MKPESRLLALLLMVGALLLVAATARAAPPEIALEVVPAEIALAPGESADVLVVARNASAGVLEEPALALLPEEGFTATALSGESAPLQPDETRAWQVRVGRDADRSRAGTVLFQLSGRWRAAEGQPPVASVAVASLAVAERALPAIETIAEVRAESALDLLEEQRPGWVYLVVRNTSQAPVTVTEIITASPPFIRVDAPDLGAGVAIAPLEARTFPVEVSARDAVRAGSHLLLFELPLEWQESGRRRVGTLVASRAVTAGVLGESDILKLVGVPSFLVLPGFLFVTAFVALWARAWPRRDPNLKPTSPEFWALAVLLSLLAGALYPFLSDLVGPRRNYYEGYGLRDIALVWIGSLLFGAIAWAASTGGGALARRIRYDLTTPAEGDAPIEMLRKLGRAGARYPFEQADVTIGGAAQRYFVLAREGDGVWVAPPARVHWTGPASGPARQAFNEALGRVRTPGELATLLETQARANNLQVTGWRETGAIKGPKRVEAGAVTVLEGVPPRAFVEEE